MSPLSPRGGAAFFIWQSLFLSASFTVPHRVDSKRLRRKGKVAPPRGESWDKAQHSKSAASPLFDGSSKAHATASRATINPPQRL